MKCRDCQTEAPEVLLITCDDKKTRCRECAVKQGFCMSCGRKGETGSSYCRVCQFILTQLKERCV